MSGLDPGEGPAVRPRGFRMERQEFKASPTSRVPRGQQAPEPSVPQFPTPLMKLLGELNE